MRIKEVGLVGAALIAGAAAGVALPASGALATACSLLPHSDGFQVASQSDLMVLDADPNCRGAGIKIYQTLDIDLDGWTGPITDWFGTFDGNDHKFYDSNVGTPEESLFNTPDGAITITNAKRDGNVQSSLDVGAFISSTQHPVTISDSSATGVVVSTDNYVGGFIGETRTTSSCTDNIDVTISDSSVSGDVIGGYGLGGFIGYANGDCSDEDHVLNLTISNSYVSGDVIGGDEVGGIVGYSDNAFISITDSYVSGSVSGGSEVGGLVGTTSQPMTIRHSYSLGYVSGTSSIVGGLVGSSRDELTIEDSYSTGSVSGSNAVGGLVGTSDRPLTILSSYSTGIVTATSSDAGGLVGDNEAELTISESFSTGNVVGTFDVGGFVGYNESGPIVIVNSYTTGDVSGINALGGFVGYSEPNVTITNSYSLRNVVSSDVLLGTDVAGFVGLISGSLEVHDSFCLDGSDGCLADGSEDVATSADLLKSRDFLLGEHGWDFTSVWCVEPSLNNGFPVLRAIGFGPGDTNNCVRLSFVPKWKVTYDPAGGVCGDRSSAWTVTVRRWASLPTAADCRRDGHVLLGWTRDVALTAPQELLTTVVARSGRLTAVWGALPAAPSTLVAFANFWCNQCTSAILVWPESSTETAVVSIDAVETACAVSGVVGDVRWCWVIGLAPGATHTASVAWRNQYGTGPATTTTVSLR